MIIKPQYPFDNWDRAYVYRHNGTGFAKNRMFVHLYNSKKERKCLSYARYLMCVKLGRVLREDETVDHINEIRTDDRIENLQILSMADNIRKNVAKRTNGHCKRTCKCPECVKHRRDIRKKSFERHRNDDGFMNRIRENKRNSYRRVIARRESHQN